MALVVKNLPGNAGDTETQVRYLGQEDSLEEGMATHSSVFCLENPMDQGAWRDPTVHRVTKNETQLKGLSMHTHRQALSS